MVGEGVAVNVFRYEPPAGEGARLVDETRVFANAHGYEWSYGDTCRRCGVRPRKVPEGWAYAYLEYTRRATTYQMAIQDAFDLWLDTGTLPGLD